VLHSLPPRIKLGDGILACHGTPDDDSTCLLEESLDDGRFTPARRDVLKARMENSAGSPHARYAVLRIATEVGE